MDAQNNDFLTIEEVEECLNSICADTVEQHTVSSLGEECDASIDAILKDLGYANENMKRQRDEVDYDDIPDVLRDLLDIGNNTSSNYAGIEDFDLSLLPEPITANYNFTQYGAGPSTHHQQQLFRVMRTSTRPSKKFKNHEIYYELEVSSPDPRMKPIDWIRKLLAEVEQIQAEYKVLALQYHPDKNSGDKDVEAKFQSLKQAKETLLDPAKRANYDKWRNSGVNISYKNWLGMKEHVHQVCKASNQFGDQRIEIRLHVNSFLSVHIHPQVQIVNSGGTAIFNCSITGTSIENVKWFHDGTMIMTDNAIHDNKIKLLTPVSLAVNNVGRNDKGIYQCSVTNNRNSAQAMVELKLGDHRKG